MQATGPGRPRWARNADGPSPVAAAAMRLVRFETGRNDDASSARITD